MEMKFMSEHELLAEINRNERMILDAQRMANNLSRRNMALRSELNRRRNDKAFSGYPVGHIFHFASTDR